MKNILFLVFTLFFSSSFAQDAHESEIYLSGIWVGEIENHPIKFEVIQKSKDSIIFSFINFQNERFNILKSDISTNEKNEFIIKIKEAKFSSPRFEKCIFSTGIVTISDIKKDDMTLNLKSVGPNCFLSYDVIMNMPDIANTILTKEKLNK